MSKKTDPKFESAYERSLLRSAFRSIFYAVISERKRDGGFTFKDFSKNVGSTRHEVSRWFNGDPNWTINTISKIARALDVDLYIEARDRKTGTVFTASGIREQVKTVDAVDARVQTLPPTGSVTITKVSGAKVESQRTASKVA